MTNTIAAQLRKTYEIQDTGDLIETLYCDELTEIARDVLDEILTSRNVTKEMVDAVLAKTSHANPHRGNHVLKPTDAVISDVRRSDVTSGLNPYQPPQVSFSDLPKADEAGSSNNDISESELIAFAGKKRYPALMLKMLEGKSRHAGFNGWAAVFGIQWYFFRKLYFFGLFSAALEVSIPLLVVWALRSSITPESRWMLLVVFSVFFVITRIIIGYMANIALCLKAVKVIKEVDELNKDNETHLRLIADAGGVSVPSLLIIYAVLGFVRVL